MKREAETDGWEWFDEQQQLATTNNNNNEEKKDSNKMTDDNDDDNEENELANDNGIIDANNEKSLGGFTSYGNLTLLFHPDRPLIVPFTQPTISLTSDDFDREQELFARLIDDEEAQKIRGETHRASLASDMSAFKAANPGCIFEDFVRWHSPRDWKLDETGKNLRGILSSRMKYKNNIWLKQWNSSLSIPAYDQQPLWDPNEIGEKLLNELENYDCSALFNQLKIIAFSHWTQSLLRTPAIKHKIGKIEDIIFKINKNITNEIETISSQSSNNNNKLLTEFTLTSHHIDEMTAAEIECSRATSLLYAFPTSIELVTSLINENTANVSNSRERLEVMQVFAVNGKDSRLSLPKPDRREFTIFVPHANSKSDRGSRVFLSVQDERINQQPTQTGFIAPNNAAATAKPTGNLSTPELSIDSTASSPSSLSVISRARKLRDTAASTARRWHQRVAAFEFDRKQPNVRLATSFISYLWNDNAE